MVVVGSVILPHGCLMFDGNPDSDSIECKERNKILPSVSERLAKGATSLFEACMKIGDDVKSFDPDVIILHTPHGIHPNGSVGLILNQIAEGDASWNSNWLDIKVSVAIDQEKSFQLLKEFKEKGISATGLTCFSISFPAPLRWGQVVPLWFVEKKISKTVKYVIITQNLPDKSLAREQMNHSVNRDIGRALYNYANNLSEKIAFVISGDLSHKHEAGCNHPLYLPDPSASILRIPDEENASKFDELIEMWVLSGKKRQANEDDVFVEWNDVEAMTHLGEATEVQLKALSCGLGGFHVLQGFLSEALKTHLVMSAIYENCAPTYYGMMAAIFKLTNKL